MESGARALFGEKYGDEVRVVSMGEISGNKAWSVELCGGTHVGRTGDIGVVVLTGESAVAAGVRRIEALTGAAARHHLAGESRQFRALAALLKAQPAEAEQRLAALIEDRRKLERELTEARKKLAMGGGSAGSGPEIRKVGDVSFIGQVLTGVDVKDLKSLADQAKGQLGTGVVALVATGEDGRAGVVVGVTPDLTGRFDAVALVRLASEVLGGKGGGGRPDLAQAGGPDGSKGADAIEAVAAALG